MKRKKTKTISYDELSTEQLRALELADAVRRLREHFGESQQKFSNRFGLTLRSIGNYETMVRSPEPRILASFAQTAVEAGRNDLADAFLFEIVSRLNLEELLGSRVKTWNPASKRGVLVHQVQGDRDNEHAEAYHVAELAKKSADRERKAKATALLDRFAEEVKKQLPGRRPEFWKTKSQVPGRDSVDR